MASGHVNRIYRPNTWLHRPMLQNVKKALANSEPSTHGHKADVMKASPDGRFSAHGGHRKRTASRHHRDPIRAINDGCPLLRAKVGRPSIDLGQRQRSFGAHAMFSRT